MGQLAIVAPFSSFMPYLVLQEVAIGLIGLLALAIIFNILRQLLFFDPSAPPEVFSLLPYVGSSFAYSKDPVAFISFCSKKYGEVFTFISLGRKITVCLGARGNDLILNGKPKDLGAAELYSGMSTPVFGTDVIYDCSDAKFTEQKRFITSALNANIFKSYVPLMSLEVESIIAEHARFEDPSLPGVVDVNKFASRLIMNTSSCSLQGPEVRTLLDDTLLDLYNDLEKGFSPANFLLPSFPFPHNSGRDRAQKQMTQIYVDIIRGRRERARMDDNTDMIWNLMSCSYKDGSPVPDKEIAHLMIAMLVAGHHSSASVVSWMLLRLATRPDIQEALLDEQKRVLGEDLLPLTYDNLQKLTLHGHVVKETLRLHGPMHSLLRQVKSPMAVMSNTPTQRKEYIIPPTHIVLSAISINTRSEQYFRSPMAWEPRRWQTEHAFANHERESLQSTKGQREPEDGNYSMDGKGAKNPYLPFGAGRHKCIGEQFVYLELALVVAMMTRSVKFRIVEGQRSGQDPIPATDYGHVFTRPNSSARVRFEKRR